MAASLAIGGVFLLAMVAATGYAAVTLPADARVPLHAGSPEYSYWVSKWAGLAVWLAVGALGFAVPAVLSAGSVSANWASSIRVTLTPAVMCVALALQAAALILARRRCPKPPAPAEAASMVSADPVGTSVPKATQAEDEDQELTLPGPATSE